MTTRALVRWSVLTIGVAMLAYLALATVTERGFGDFVGAVLIVALLGGAAMATMRLAFGRSARQHVADPFSRDVFATDTVNISHIRVAGVGGAGLVLAAFVVALQYQLTTIAMSAGIIGGLLLAVAMIVSRRRKRAGHLKPAI